ncbi:hypothetical protein F5Y16DRAFT_192986 [Xylariaceae sp. FL0255]|nr:hypothetical protein F5Y16DRAFT_192986 [Xylariaceae sp. FL0255]
MTHSPAPGRDMCLPTCRYLGNPYSISQAADKAKLRAIHAYIYAQLDIEETIVVSLRSLTVFITTGPGISTHQTIPTSCLAMSYNPAKSDSKAKMPPVQSTIIPPPHLQAAWDRYRPQQTHRTPPPQLMDASSLHPVFFTARLWRSPPSVPNTTAPISGGMSPVAHGYIYREEPPLPRRSGGSML